jgi:tetratricopeptide (TPR) repeat protein
MGRIFNIIFLLAFVFISISNGQPLNELPLYGGFKKTVSQKQADEVFIRSAIHEMGSREKAAEHIVVRGWQALSRDDIKTAIKRFNQAWLINPDNGQVYWGLAITQAKQEKFDSAIELFRKGDKIIKDNPRFFADYGYAITRKSTELKNKKLDHIAISEKGIEILKKAITLDPDLGDVYFYMAIAEFNRDKYKEAWRNIKLAKEKGYSGITKAFLTALEQKLPEPSQ